LWGTGAPGRPPGRTANPSLIVEVLSDSTKTYDRGDKFALYCRIPSLREYLLVSQDRIRVECYRRGEDGRWTLTDYTGLEDRIPLKSLGYTLVSSEVYDKLEFATARGPKRR